MAHEIFVSLTNDDHKFAEAIGRAIHDLLGDLASVHFSTNKNGAGIPLGEDWFRWIGERVKACDFSLILVTPASAATPWILWEAGAVYGAALASRNEVLRKVRPLVYRLEPDDIPSPIKDSKIQFMRGDLEEDVREFLKEILQQYCDEIPPERLVSVNLNEIVATYMKAVADVDSCAAQCPLIPSLLPVMVMTVPDLTVRRASKEAMSFFGFDGANLDKVIGRKIPELISEMKGFLHPPRAFFSDMGKDQERVLDEVKSGKITYARVPIRINEFHPSAGYRNKTFVPIITEKETRSANTFLRILYLDAEQLPKNLFTEAVWHKVIQGLDLKALGDDLEKIKAVYEKNQAFDEDSEEGVGLDALKESIRKLADGGTPSILEDLSKVGWFELRQAAMESPEKPRRVLDVINRVLGLL